MSLIDHIENIKFKKIGKHLRNTPRGLFVNEESLSFIAKLLSNYFKTARMGTLPSIKEVAAEISKNDTYYLLKEPNLLVGYLCEDTYLERAPSDESTLISCRNKILIGDPMFLKHRNIDLILDPQLIAKFDIFGTDYDITKHAFTKFNERMEFSRALINQSDGELPEDLRDRLKMLYGVFKNSQPVTRNNYVSQFIKYGFKDTDYSTNLGWIFVVQEGVLKTCYEIENLESKGYELK